jgi:hypothetical protein
VASFWTENKDFAALLISLCALVISTYLGYRGVKVARDAASQNVRTSREVAEQNVAATRQIAEDSARHNRELAQAATYQRIHELLVEPKAAAGRRMLFQADSAGTFPKLGERGWDEINYSLALYDTLGGYVYRKQVLEAIVLDAWHHPLRNITGPVQNFMRHREKEQVYQPWAHLMELLRKAEVHACGCPKLDG